MIELELRNVPEGGHDYVAVARLIVHDDDRTEIWDPDDLIPTELYVLVVDDTTPRRISYQDDPATWARNLHSVLRTGYLVPVVTRDDAQPATP